LSKVSLAKTLLAQVYHYTRYHSKHAKNMHLV